MRNNTKNIRKGIAAILFAAIIVASALAIMPTATAVVPSRTYTTDADFDEGVLVSVEHETVHDQLQLSTKVTTLPFIWVPNNEGTVSKIDTRTGNELGRYWVSSGGDSSPSRTTVDLLGNCWVGCRQRGTVVKIGLYEAGQWIDRNGDGVCQTSQDANSDGNIAGLEILPWGQDECVLYEVVLVPGFEGRYVPGTFNPANYDYNYWGVSPRGLAIDSNNNLWAGTWSTNKYFNIDGTTGAIIKKVDVSPHNAYGAAIDRNGILWSAEGPGGDQPSIILRLDTSTDAISFHDIGHTCYGLGLDYNNHLWITSYGDNRMSRLDILTNPPTFVTYNVPEQISSRGVAATSDNNVWVANTDAYTVTRYDNNGILLATITPLGGPTGVSVDADGKVWSTDNYDEYLHRINPATNMIDLSKQIIGSAGHYTYSDMTGIVSRTITTRTGTWTVDFDSEEEDTPWGMVSWTALEPEGTLVTVRVRSSNDRATWSLWEPASNGIPLSATPDGRYLQIEATLRIVNGEVSPILYDLTVKVANQPPDVSEAYPSIGCLWPPNNKFVDITIEGVTDPDGDVVTITITKVTSDEPTASIKGAAGAKLAPDAYGVGTGIASLRAERSGTGNGRVYEITFVASDGKGGKTEGSVFVKVPHDQSDECVSIDDGQNYDATAIN